jgi:hypothetical protein
VPSGLATNTTSPKGRKATVTTGLVSWAMLSVLFAVTVSEEP